MRVKVEQQLKEGGEAGDKETRWTRDNGPKFSKFLENCGWKMS